MRFSPWRSARTLLVVGAGALSACTASISGSGGPQPGDEGDEEPMAVDAARPGKTDPPGKPGVPDAGPPNPAPDSNAPTADMRAGGDDGGISSPGDDGGLADAAAPDGPAG